MFPENRLSKTPVPSDFNKPKKTKLTDYEWGGVDIRNTTQGLYHSIWRGEYQGDSIKVTNDINTHFIPTPSNLQEVSFCFDYNMNYMLAYTDDQEKSYIEYYDTLENDYVKKEIVGKNLIVSLDVAKPYLSSTNDIILSYIKDDSLCFRLQRERFDIERVLKTGVTSLYNAGLMTNFRFGWEVE